MDKLCSLGKYVYNCLEPIGKGAKTCEKEQKSGTEKKSKKPNAIYSISV